MYLVNGKAEQVEITTFSGRNFKQDLTKFINRNDILVIDISYSADMSFSKDNALVVFKRI